MRSFFEAHSDHLRSLNQHRDKISDAMSSLFHRHIDDSIQKLEKFHAHVSNDASEFKPDILAQTLKNAIDQHHHFKKSLMEHKDTLNSKKQTLRRIAMSTIAAFGLMSGVKAADMSNTNESQLTTASNSVSAVTSSTVKSFVDIQKDLKLIEETLNTENPNRGKIETWKTLSLIERLLSDTEQTKYSISLDIEVLTETIQELQKKLDSKEVALDEQKATISELNRNINRLNRDNEYTD